MNYGDFTKYYYLRSTTSRTDKKGLIAVYFRLEKDGKRKECSTKVYGPKKYWSNNLKRFDHTGALSKKANKELEAFRARVEEIQYKLLKDGDEVGLDTFFLHVTGKVQIPHLMEVFRARIEEIESLEGTEFAPATTTTYRVAEKHLQAFMHKKKKVDDIVLRQVNKEFVKSFYMYLKSIMSVNSANKNMRKFKAVIKNAYENELLRSNPCLGVVLHDEETKKVYLTEKELSILAKKKIKIKRLAVVRDLFLFQCFTAMAYADIKGLKPEHIIEEEGKLYISKDRQKTSKTADIPLFPETKAILDKYAYLHAEGKCLPVPTNQRMNGYLKEIGDICGFQKELKSHVGRHTFAMTMLNRGMDQETLRRIMGLSSIKHVQVYARLLKSTIHRVMTEVGPILGTR